jgi:hypothetical protein
MTGRGGTTRRGAFAALRRIALGAVALALAGGTAPVAAQSQAPLPPGRARVWFYRDYEPYESLSRPYVRMNGGIVGISEPGGSFYRDVAPGRYTLTVDSWGSDVNQFPVVTLAPGEVVYAKIESLDAWSTDGSDRAPYQRDTFYVRLIPPPAALAELPSHPYDAGR